MKWRMMAMNETLELLMARKSVRVGEGAELAVSSGKDGIHVKDEDDPKTGFAYLSGGSVALSAGDDGISTESNRICW